VFKKLEHSLVGIVDVVELVGMAVALALVVDKAFALALVVDKALALAFVASALALAFVALALAYDALALVVGSVALAYHLRLGRILLDIVSALILLNPFYVFVYKAKFFLNFLYSKKKEKFNIKVF